MQYIIDKKKVEEENLKNNYTKLIEGLDILKTSYMGEDYIKQSNAHNFGDLIEKQLIPVFEKYEEVLGGDHKNELMMSLKKIHIISELSRIDKDQSVQLSEILNDSVATGKQIGNYNDSADSKRQANFEKYSRDMMSDKITESTVQEEFQFMDLKAESRDDIQKKFLKSYLRRESDNKAVFNATFKNLDIKNSVRLSVYDHKVLEEETYPDQQMLLSDTKMGKNEKKETSQHNINRIEKLKTSELYKSSKNQKLDGLCKFVGSDNSKIFLKGFSPREINGSNIHVNSKIKRSHSILESKESGYSSSGLRRNVSAVEKDKIKNKISDVKNVKDKSLIGVKDKKLKKKNREMKNDKLSPRRLTPKLKNTKTPKTDAKLVPKLKQETIAKPKNNEISFSKMNKKSSIVTSNEEKHSSRNKQTTQSSFYPDSVKSLKPINREVNTKVTYKQSTSTKNSTNQQTSQQKLNIEIIKTNNSKVNIKQTLNENNEKCILIDVTRNVEERQEFVLDSGSLTINTVVRNKRGSKATRELF